MKRFLKTFFKLIVYLLAVIGVLAVCLLIAVNKLGY